MYEDGLEYEVLVVDDVSKDDTALIVAEYAQYMPVRLERHAMKLGLGATTRDGPRLRVWRYT